MGEKKNTLSELKEKEREVRRDLIIDAAQKVFGLKTYDRVSMNEIAREAGIAKSSIYTYFPNQEALFLEAAFRETDSFISDLKEKLSREEQSPIRMFIVHFLDYYSRHESHWRMITHFSLYGNIGAESSDKLNSLARRFMDLLDLVFHNVQDPAVKRLLSHTLFSALSGILIAFRKYPGRTETERIRHIRRIGGIVEQMMTEYVRKSS